MHRFAEPELTGLLQVMNSD